jgi:uroporphyrin-III C-methyltransferase
MFTPTVYLVGAGPGDPELLTQRAVRLLAQADVVLFDELVSPSVQALIAAHAEKIPVGKRARQAKCTEPSTHAQAQAHIHMQLLSHAQTGKKVVRLKGGDPLMFGRAGEEMAFLKAHGVHVEIVCGVTAALAAAASLGVSLTHRDWASGVLFITGHRQYMASSHEPHDVHEAHQPNDPDWPFLAQAVVRLRLTLVIYMGRHHERAIAQSLAQYCPPDTPVARVEAASTPQERQTCLRLDQWAQSTFTSHHSQGLDVPQNLPCLWIVGPALHAALPRP